jgi:hypothetical protein
MLRTVLLALAAALVAGESYVHGLWTNRWSNSRALEEAVARLQQVPVQVGDWSAETRELDRRTLAQAGFAGYLSRTYRRPDGFAVNVLLACGPAGPLSLHTPQICYGGAGYHAVGDISRQDVDVRVSPASGAFWKARFAKEEALVPVSLRILYAWHVNRAWTAADNPRLSFAGLPVVHKMYLTYPLSASDERPDDAACAEFMGRLLPELERTVFSPP